MNDSLPKISLRKRKSFTVKLPVSCQSSRFGIWIRRKESGSTCGLVMNRVQVSLRKGKGVRQTLMVTEIAESLVRLLEIEEVPWISGSCFMYRDACAAGAEGEGGR